jgi:hypothetical protein
MPALHKLKSGSKNPFEGRHLGLGQVPDGDAVQSMVRCPFSSVPVIEHVTWTTTVPLLDKDIDATFGDEVTPLQDPRTVPGILSVDSSFIINGLLQCHMLCYGIGIHIFGEPLSFTIEGNGISASAIAPIASPDVFTQNDLANDAMGSADAVAGTVYPALLEWGFADWMAAWHMANAYEVNWWFNQRYTLLKEMLADVSYFGPYAEAVASGTSSIAAQQFFAQVNGTYVGLASPYVIQPVGFRRLGSVNTGGTAGGPNYAVMRPTRDFDLADVTFGGLRNQGTAGCGSPFRKFTQPVFLEKGNPIGLQLQAKDAYHQAQMQRYLSITESGAGTPANIAFSAQAGLNGLSTAGSATTAVEQTLDQTPNLVTQRGQTNRMLFKGGAFKVAFLLKGFEVSSQQWFQSIMQGTQAGAIVNANAGLGNIGLSPIS